MKSANREYLPAVDHLPLLYAGRLLQGVVSGVVFSVANARITGRENDR